MSSFENVLIENLPDISKISFKKIHKDYLKALLIYAFIMIMAFFVGAFFLIKYKLKEVIPEHVNYIYLGIFVFFTLFIWYLVVSFSKRKYAVREKDISYKRGVIIKTLTTIPFSRIQHVELDEAPILRIFKLASISVFTAGDSSDDLVLKGIKKNEALQIKEFISSKINE